jgi:hypothetical protein
LQVVRVATPSTQAAWVERARHRTLKHLREEVMAALMAVRISGEPDCPPPVDGEMQAFLELEQAVVSGRVQRGQPANDGSVLGPMKCEATSQEASEERCGAEGEADAVRLTPPSAAPRRAWRVMLGSLAAWLEGGLQMSAARGDGPASSLRSKGRVALRWRLSRANRAWWHALEAQARRWLPRGTSWLAFLCHSIWNAWRHLLGMNVAYAQVYVRDRYRCSSPVCNRRDVTPHHLQFRSAGGSDDDDNVAACAPGAICSACTAAAFAP